MRPTLTAPLLASLLTAAAAPAPAPADKRQETTTSDPELSIQARLKLADSHAARYSLLPNDTDFIFDFNTASYPMATSANFPALVGTGVAIAYAVFPPCSMSLLHLHPRATEIFILTNGAITTSMVPEAGVLTTTTTTAQQEQQRVIYTNLTAGMVTVFPQGSLHTQTNLGCENGTAVAAFNSDDPGVGPIVSELLALTDQVVLDSFGGSVDETLLAAMRADEPKTGTTGLFSLNECAAKCGIAR